MITSMRRRWPVVLIVWCAGALGAWLWAHDAASPSKAEQIARGRYLVKIAGCNDCHTPGYLQSNGQVSEEQWLLGDQLGWRGPWGTTYASNLRIYMSALSEDEWVHAARTLQARPPMPWFNLNAMQEDDLRAIYTFVRSLGPVGDPAPAYLAPGEEPTTPFALFPSPPPQPNQH